MRVLVTLLALLTVATLSVGVLAAPLYDRLRELWRPEVLVL